MVEVLSRICVLRNFQKSAMQWFLCRKDAWALTFENFSSKRMSDDFLWNLACALVINRCFLMYLCISSTYMYIYIHIYVYTNIYTYKCEYIYVYTNICIYICVCVCVCVCVYIYVCICFVETLLHVSDKQVNKYAYQFIFDIYLCIWHIRKNVFW